MRILYPFYCIDKGIEITGRDLGGEFNNLVVNLINIHLGDTPPEPEIDIYKLINSGVYFNMSSSRKKINCNKSQNMRKQKGFCYFLLVSFDTEFFPTNERSFTRTLRFKCYYGLDVSKHCDSLVQFPPRKRLRTFNTHFGLNNKVLYSTFDHDFLDKFFSLLVKKGFTIHSI